MKINHMVCPTCGHDFYVDAAYATCDACQTHFYASQSRTRNAHPVSAVAAPPQEVKITIVPYGAPPLIYGAGGSGTVPVRPFIEAGQWPNTAGGGGGGS